MQAYTENESDPIPNGPTDYYAKFNGSISIFKTSIYTAVTIISDAFIVSFYKTSLGNLDDLTRRPLH